MMVAENNVTTYIVVTPVKDEERYIAYTLESVISQTVTPLRWVLVDDGSTDMTGKIIHSYIYNYAWISYIRIERNEERILGAAEIKAFSLGYDSVRQLDHGYVVKLDADLILPSNYFEQMLYRFDSNPRLGIASGIYLEKKNQSWNPVILPQYHAAGAAKMASVACFRAIGGFPLSPGWDTVDEIKAWTCGWETAHFPEIKFHHLKTEGSAMGSLRMNYFHGEIYYVSGGSVLFFIGKLLHRMVAGTPPFVAGVMLFCGCLHAFLSRRPKLVSLREEAYYKRLLNRRFVEQLTSKLFHRA